MAQIELLRWYKFVMCISAFTGPLCVQVVKGAGGGGGELGLEVC